MNDALRPVNDAEILQYIAEFLPDADLISVEREYDWRSDETFVRIGGTVGARREYVVYQAWLGHAGLVRATKKLRDGLAATRN